jgi:hypothetical protein
MLSLVKENNPEDKEGRARNKNKLHHGTVNIDSALHTLAGHETS